MDKDRARAKQQIKGLPFKKKWEHFWFYYRIHTIVAIITAIIVGWSVVQCVMQIDYDLNISFYSSHDIGQENTDALTEILKEQSYDINDNGAVDIFIAQCIGDITRTDYMDQSAQATLMKLQAELTANECPAYIMDKSYKDKMMAIYTDVVDEVVEISQVPAVKERLKLADGEELYLITLLEYENAKNDEELLKKYELVGKIKEYFKNSIK